MTGFGTKTATFTLADGSKIHVLINLKTLNSRFFETTCKLSYTLSHLETELIRILKKKLVRGHAYLTMHILNSEAFQGKVTPSISMIESYVSAIDQVKKNVKLEGSLSINDLLNLKGIFEIEEKRVDKAFEKQILEVVTELADDVVKTRVEEGKSLEKDLKQRFAIMKKEISSIEISAEKLVTEKKEEITKLVQEMETLEEETGDSRKSHLYIALDKMDIHEEIVRFKSHLENIQQQFDSPTIEKGKRLDFTLQELAREINTLSSKCADATITSQAINVKVELEKSREQVQNVV